MSDDHSALIAALTGLQAELKQLRESRESATARELAAVQDELKAHRRLLRVLVDQATAQLHQDVVSTIAPVQLSFAETLRVVNRDRLSLTRFGDGELKLMTDPGHHLQFQRNSPELMRDLRDALAPQGPARGRVLVALPHLFRADLHWIAVWIAVWPMLRPLLDPAARYGNAHVSRPIYFSTEGAAGVDLWRQIWHGREVLIVTGRNSRFDLLPALFDGVARAEFLHTRAENAYADCDAIVEQVRARARPDLLVLLSLGPAATVLAPRIAAAGIQALDIGHISASYLNVFASGKLPEKLGTTRSG